MELRPILSAMTRRKTGAVLIALQIALTLAILSNALYVVKDRLDESQRTSGLDESLVFHISVIDKERDITGASASEDLDALRGLPGIVSAVWVNQVPLSNSGGSSGYDVKPNSENTLATAATYMADPGLLKTWGVQLLEGRDFRSDEALLIDENLPGAPEPKTAILTSAMARALYPESESVIGKSMYWGSRGPIEIVGVVDTLVSPWGRSSWGGGEGSLSVILPVRLVQNWRTYAVRVDDPAALNRLSKDADTLLLKRVSGRLSGGVKTMTETRDERYRGEHTLVNGLLIVMGLLLVMTASGIVGLASLWVNQRRKQIGIRRALGARRSDIIRMFLAENLVITTLGVVLGIGLALGLNAVMMAQLELARLPWEFLAIGAALLLSLGVASVAGPALRAASVPPAVATRSV